MPRLASNIAKGIQYAADYTGVKIINLSLQQDPDQTACQAATTDKTACNKKSPVLEDAIKYAQSKGILVVAAAGNQFDTAPSYPAAYDGVLSVAAVDGSDDSLAKFSRHGPWVDIAAPGVGVLTLATPCAASDLRKGSPSTRGMTSRCTARATRRASMPADEEPLGPNFISTPARAATEATAAEKAIPQGPPTPKPATICGILFEIEPNR